mgnify:FL=1
MRYVVVLVLAMAFVAAPLGANAQEADHGTTPEPSVEEPAVSDDSAGNEGGLSPRLRNRTQRNWDPSAYDVSGDSRPIIQYTAAPPKKPARPQLAPGIGLGVSIASLVGGLAMVGVGVTQGICISFGEPCETPASSSVLIGTGAVLSVGGLIGTIVSGIALSDSERAGAKAPKQRNVRRLQWDLGQSRLVF